MKLNLLVTSLLVILLQTVFVYGQERIPNPEETADLVDSAYKILGPEVGCVLYEEGAVLTLAHRQLKYRRYNENFTEDEEKTRQLNALGEKFGLRFLLEDSYLSVASRPAIEAYLASENADWFVPLEADSDPLDWCDELAVQLSDESGKISMSLYDILPLGLPTSILDSMREVESSGNQGHQLIDVWLFDSPRFYNANNSFSTLPKDAASEALTQWLSKRRVFVDKFYALQSVQDRIKDENFLQARRALNESVYIGSQREAWWIGKGLDSLETFQYSYIGDTPTLWQERLLNAHYQDWAAQIESGSHPAEWVESFNRWSYEAGADTPVNLDILGTWMWEGAYQSTPARATVYKSAKSAFPEYFVYRAKAKFNEWVESGYLKYREDMVMPLFEHPEIKVYFESLPEEEKNAHRREFKKAMTTDAVTKLLSSPPYLAGE